MVRLDLFLKNTGLVKQRGAAKRACDEGRVCIDGKRAKPAQKISVGEIITITAGTHCLEAEVLDIPLRPASREQRDRYYRLLRREQRDLDEDLSF